MVANICAQPKILSESMYTLCPMQLSTGSLYLQDRVVDVCLGVCVFGWLGGWVAGRVG